MQGTASLKPYINSHRKPVNVIKTNLQRQIKATISVPKSRKNISIASSDKSNDHTRNIILQGEPFTSLPPLPSANVPLSDGKYMAVKNHLSTIEDPLWKHICQDVLEMMGPVSTLIIWKSKLGQFSHHDEILPIICENEETAFFIQQYDFVIIASIQKYFPALKKLEAVCNPEFAVHICQKTLPN